MKLLRWLRVGLVLGPTLAIGLLLMSSSVFAQDVRSYIPKNAFQHFPTVMSEQARIFPDSPLPFYIDSLAEQESCISLKHSKCWSTESELKTSRELGSGIFQVTKAYTAKGTIRFDTLSDLRKKYPKELGELAWANIKDRPDLQIRAGILLVKDNYDALYMIPNPYDRLAMADSAYNGGMGNLQKSRRVCGLTEGCDPNRWFGNVEVYLVQSRQAIYGNRSPFEINQEHVRNTMTLRLWKYRPYTY